MYIKNIRIKNIRSIADFNWSLDDSKKAPGWHVLIGDNGSGKSSVLRAVSLALIGPRESFRLNPIWEEWLRNDTDKGSIMLEVWHEARIDPQLKPGNRTKNNIEVELNLERQTPNGKVNFSEFASRNDGTSRERADNYIWNERKGWFSAAFGPFRRFAGGDMQNQIILSTPGKAAAHASVFFESIALSSYRQWLANLDYTSTSPSTNEQDSKLARTLLGHLTDFINQEDFLPFDTRLDAIVPSPAGPSIIFVDGSGNHVSIEQLGDGYRSILSMTLELIRQMTLQYDLDTIFDPNDPTVIHAPGVVLVDEIDAHLHPEWQRRIGGWLTTHFPNIQFIVTTHSPLVCQAASRGTIWRLPTPGSDEPSREVTRDSEDWKRLVNGNILEAYSTDLFGEHIDRSPEAQALLDRVADLSIKQLDAPLTAAEQAELDRSRDALPSTPSSTPMTSIA